MSEVCLAPTLPRPLPPPQSRRIQLVNGPLIVRASERYTIRKTCTDRKRKIRSDDGLLMKLLPLKRS